MFLYDETCDMEYTIKMKKTEEAAHSACFTGEKYLSYFDHYATSVAE